MRQHLIEMLTEVDNLSIYRPFKSIKLFNPKDERTEFRDLSFYEFCLDKREQKHREKLSEFKEKYPKRNFPEIGGFDNKISQINAKEMVDKVYETKVNALINHTIAFLNGLLHSTRANEEEKKQIEELLEDNDKDLEWCRMVLYHQAILSLRMHGFYSVVEDDDEDDFGLQKKPDIIKKEEQNKEDKKK